MCQGSKKVNTSSHDATLITEYFGWTNPTSRSMGLSSNVLYDRMLRNLRSKSFPFPLQHNLKICFATAQDFSFVSWVIRGQSGRTCKIRRMVPTCPAGATPIQAYFSSCLTVAGQLGYTRTKVRSNLLRYIQIAVWLWSIVYMKPNIWSIMYKLEHEQASIPQQSAWHWHCMLRGKAF